jgi:hypothetical protein
VAPQQKVLQLLALVACSRHNGREYVSTLSDQLVVKFPQSIDQFLASDVYPQLSPVLEAFFLTVQPTYQDTRQQFLAAVQALELAPVAYIGACGPDIKLPPAIEKWRKHKTVRIFIEACMLAGISVTIIAEDLRRVWNLDVSEDDLHLFRSLFADTDGLRGDGWYNYELSVGKEEATFKHRLVGQPHDFVRWKLGVPVCLDSDQVINRLVSDAYYTERQIKFDAGPSVLDLTKDQMARLKLERDTIFKGLNLRVKIADSKTGGSLQSAQAAITDFLSKMTLVTEPVPTDGPLAQDLASLNAQLPPLTVPGVPASS